MGLCEREKCTGCGVCFAVCSHDAISFVYDDLGFRYPVINASRCVDCGLCSLKCPSVNPVSIEERNDCYLSWAIDDRIHYDSASGGLSYIMCRRIIESGGFAVGCIWDENFNAVMGVIDNVHDLRKTIGSKYVQSYINDSVWKEIKSRLGSGQHGIIIGLPCQIAAIKSYTNNHRNLILCDLLCHGGCSPRCFSDHITYLKRKKRLQKITGIRFRGGKYNCQFTLWNGDKLLYKDWQYTDSYFYSFMKHGLFHESCYQCQYAKANRVSDITIADYWGIDSEFVKNKHTMNGTNLVVLHSGKGQSIFNEIRHMVEAYERPYEEAVAGNDTLRAPTDAPSDREQILKSISQYGFEYTIKKDPVNRRYIFDARKAFLKAAFRKYIPNIFVKLIKHVLRS